MPPTGSTNSTQSLTPPWLTRRPEVLDLPPLAPRRPPSQTSSSSSIPTSPPDPQTPNNNPTSILTPATLESALPTPTATTTHKPSHRAYLQVLVTHLVMFNSFGLIQSFGIFQPSYETAFSLPPSTIAWIGSIHIFFVYGLGIATGWILSRNYYRTSLLLGSVLQIIGLAVAGFSRAFAMSFVFHGVFQGVGHGLMFCPAITMTAVEWRGKKWRMLALGIGGCGASTGGMVFAGIARYTIGGLGVGPTLWIMCGVVCVNSVVIQGLARGGYGGGREKSVVTTTMTNSSSDDEARDGSGLEVATTTRSSQRHHILNVFRRRAYTLYVLATFATFTALWIPFFYTREYTSLALHVTKPQSFVLLIILNAAGDSGRIVPALLADRYIGTLNTYILTLALSSATLLAWPAVSSVTGMYPWATAYGFCAGGVSSLLQAGIASLNDDAQKTGIEIGVAFSVVAFASLLGAPVGGELIQVGEKVKGEGTGAYLYMMVLTGVARVVKTGWRLWVMV
ncbi:major facilitator superfamily domain-containing protein [Paraphoma chrysanthemicola]|uniref:Major facilitator superfamily domain-containing protein n=1 Tax=Paraphoma chrysanthemicola TaxID=798071 RepID=A0A8K0R5K1_9PLEO|nr:major facilitator superfamily domain-containing protein [Paraphoma chrysanthemicola]